MKTLKLPAAALAMLIAAGCASTSQQRAELPEETRKLLEDIEVPEKVGKLSIQDSTAYSNPAMGISYLYAGDVALQANVYIYPIGEPSNKKLVPDEAAVLEAGYESFMAELAAVKSHGTYEDYDVVEKQVSDAVFEFPSRDGRAIQVPYKILQARFNIRANTQDYASFLVLTEFKEYFIKIRVTHPDYPGLADNVDYFASELIEELYRRDTGKPGLSMNVEGSDTVYYQQPGESSSQFMRRGLRDIVESSAKEQTESEPDSE